MLFLRLGTIAFKRKQWKLSWRFLWFYEDSENSRWSFSKSVSMIFLCTISTRSGCCRRQWGDVLIVNLQVFELIGRSPTCLVNKFDGARSETLAENNWVLWIDSIPPTNVIYGYVQKEKWFIRCSRPGGYNRVVKMIQNLNFEESLQNLKLESLSPGKQLEAFRSSKIALNFRLL